MLYDRDMTTIINEFDERCPPEICTVPCETTDDTTTAIMPTTSQGTTILVANVSFTVGRRSLLQATFTMVLALASCHRNLVAR